MIPAHLTRIFRGHVEDVEKTPLIPSLYGIKSCDTMKKARAWLADHQQPYHFHDYKTAGIEAVRLEAWCQEHGWTQVLDRSGTTFRKLDEAQRVDLDQAKAIALMQAQPSMIRRPVLDLGNRTLIGFSPEHYAAALIPSGSDTSSHS